MIKIPDEMRALVNNGLADGLPCLVGTVGEDGFPSFGPKGSVLVLDDQTLAYWERSHRSSIANVRNNPKVMIYYRNPAPAAREKLPPGGAVRFYGRAEVHETGPLREKVKALVVPAEIEKDPDSKGVAVVVHVDKIGDLGGRVLQSR
jgi:predicted pyridoxine 5'-phosphate oxidase superfamily flavin-nucleotide-binding protein